MGFETPNEQKKSAPDQSGHSGYFHLNRQNFISQGRGQYNRHGKTNTGRKQTIASRWGGAHFSTFAKFLQKVQNGRKWENRKRFPRLEGKNQSVGGEKRRKRDRRFGGEPSQSEGGSVCVARPPRGMGGTPPSNCLGESALVLTNGTEAFRSLGDSDGE